MVLSFEKPYLTAWIPLCYGLCLFIRHVYTRLLMSDVNRSGNHTLRDALGIIGELLAGFAIYVGNTKKRMKERAEARAIEAQQNAEQQQEPQQENNQPNPQPENHHIQQQDNEEQLNPEPEPLPNPEPDNENIQQQEEVDIPPEQGGAHPNPEEQLNQEPPHNNELQNLQNDQNEMMEAFVREMNKYICRQILVIALLLFGLGGFSLLKILMIVTYASKPSQRSLFDFTFLLVLCIFNIVFCKKICSIQMHSHHILSFLLLTFGFLIANAYTIYQGLVYFDYVILLIAVFFGVAFSFLEVFSKFMMTVSILNPFTLLWVKGMITGFSLLITGIIVSSSSSEAARYLRRELDEIRYLFLKDTYAICIGYIILNTLVSLSFVYTLTTYNAITRVVINYNTLAFAWIYSQIEGPHLSVFIVLGVIGHIIQVFGGLVFHEIVIVHLFSFDKNTIRQIALRSESENVMLMTEYRHENNPPN